MEPEIILKRNQKLEDGVVVDDFYTVFFYTKKGTSETSFTISTDKLELFAKLLAEKLNITK